RATGLAFFWWFGPLFVYGVIPFFELAIGTDRGSRRRRPSAGGGPLLPVLRLCLHPAAIRLVRVGHLDGHARRPRPRLRARHHPDRQGHGRRAPSPGARAPP